MSPQRADGAPRRARRAPARRGATLLETLVGAVGAALLLTAAARLLANVRRDAREQQARRDGRTALAQGGAVLAAELRALAPDARGEDPGDLVVAHDTLLEVRATVGAAVACDGTAGAVLELPASSRAEAPPYATWREAPARHDLVLVHLRGAAPDGREDAWLARTVVAVETGACRTGPFAAAAVAGAARHRLRLDAPLPVGVAAGTPVRVVRRRRWVHYRGGDGRWALGQRAWEGEAFAPPQPVAAPLASPAAGGMRVTLLDAAGAPVADPRVASVASVRVVLRAPAGRRGGAPRDSVVVAPRPWGGEGG